MSFQEIILHNFIGRLFNFDMRKFTVWWLLYKLLRNNL